MSDQNLFQPPESDLTTDEISSTRELSRTLLGLFVVAPAGGAGFPSTCGAIGLATVVSFGLYPAAAAAEFLTALTFVAGGTLGFWLFLRVFRAIVEAEAAVLLNRSSSDGIYQYCTNRKSP